MIEHDDPRLTAYALGEADGETVVAVEAALRDSDALRAAVDDIRRTADAVSLAFASEEAPALLPEQRRTIQAQAPSASARRAGRLPVWLAVAASVAAIAVALFAVRRETPLTTPQPAPRPAVASSRGEPRTADASSTPRPEIAAAPATVGGIAGDETGGVPRGEAKRHVDTPATMSVLSEADVAVSSALIAPTPPAFAGPIAVGRLGYVRGNDRFAFEAPRDFNTEGYAYREDSDFLEVAVHPLSTFSVDVDTASYANVRRILQGGLLPPPDAVRIEEMVNYFPYDYAPPGGEAFAAHMEVARAPWNREHQLLRIGLKAREIDLESRPASNLVFLIDVSGSMSQPNKLPLVRRALNMLVQRLDGRDRVALVVYAGQAGLVLPSTPADRKVVLSEAIDRLEAGGSTNGGDGIRLAYDIAARHLVRGGVNRVVLATDGDFNVGVTDEGSLVRLVQEKARGGVFLTVLGFGMGNLQDGRLETLADKGNGNYAYIDTESEARKALVDQMTSTLVTVAKDVKIQVEFNPARVAGYRLIGYENRALRPEDFKDDRKDAGEVGAGHAVTALYEIVPVGTPLPRPRTEPLTYQGAGELSAAARGEELARVALRYKEPESETSRAREWPVSARPVSLEEASADFRFAAAVAQFGMLLRDSPHKGSASFPSVLSLADAARGGDAEGYRTEFVALVKRARYLRARE